MKSVNIQVLQAVRWDLLLIAHPNELGSLSGFIGVDDRDLICDDTNRETFIVID